MRPALILTLLMLCLASIHIAARAQASSGEAGLPAALQLALRKHPALAGKQALLRSKEATADSTRAQRYPTLSASVGGGQTDGFNSHTGTLRAQQPLWAFGRIDKSIAYADTDTRVQAADIWQTRRELIEETAAAYAQVQGQRERLVVAVQSVSRHEELRQQIARREQGGMAATVDMRMAQTRWLQARAQQESVIADLKAAQASLLALTQDPVGSDVPVPAQSTVLPDEAVQREEAQRQNAGLDYKQALVSLAEADLDRESVSAMPTVLLDVSRNLITGVPNTPSSTSATVLLQGSLEGMGFAQKGRTRAAFERAEAARQDLNLARHDLDVRLQQLQDKCASDQILLSGYTESVAALEDTLGSFRRQYESGYKSWLDVLNTVRELSDQQLQRVQVLADWRTNTLRLAALMGRLDDAAGLNANSESKP